MAIIKWALGYISVTLFCLNDEIRLFILYNTHITPYIKSSKDFANFLKNFRLHKCNPGTFRRQHFSQIMKKIARLHLCNLAVQKCNVKKAKTKIENCFIQILQGDNEKLQLKIF